MGRDPALPEPDFTDPFAPDPDSQQELHCRQCDATFAEAAVVYDDRHGQRLWWCPNLTCDGRGVGIDLVPLDAPTPPQGLVAPDRTAVPRGYRSKTIPPADLPAQWRITAEERTQHEITNRYHHEHLDIQMKIVGIRTGADEPMAYKIWLTTPADASLEYDIPFSTAADMTAFDPARTTATELMDRLNQAAQDGTDGVIQTAMHQMNPDHHQQPEPDEQATDPAHICNTCGMDTSIYRGTTPDEQRHHHIDHMPDETHAG
jgi:hypothetical protein